MTRVPLWMGVMISVGGLVASCSRDMAEQPSYHPQEQPRKHSPTLSIPQSSRVIRSSRSDGPSEHPAIAARLFAINCVHCHGSEGHGDGPVAGYLLERPENLHSREVRTKSQDALYAVITDGHKGMPAFRGYLSADERSLLAAYVNSFDSQNTAPDGP